MKIEFSFPQLAEKAEKSDGRQLAGIWGRMIAESLADLYIRIK